MIQPNESAVAVQSATKPEVTYDELGVARRASLHRRKG